MGGGGGGMHHGGNHGDMDMGHGACKMNMIWSWSVPTDGTCVVFSSWQINSNRSFVSSMLFIIFLGAVYEWLRLKIRTMDAGLAADVVHSPHRRRASVLPTTNLYSDPNASASSSSASDVSVHTGDRNEVRGLLSRKGKGKGKGKGQSNAGSRIAIV
jgi:solute carrier family 31 (copper transporter), member 1